MRRSRRGRGLKGSAKRSGIQVPSLSRRWSPASRSRWPAPGIRSSSPWPAIMRTTSLAIGGSSSSAVPCTSSRGALEQLGHLASGRLGGQRDDARRVPAERDAGVDGHGAAEAVADHDEAPGADPAGHVGRGGDVHHAAVEVVRSPVADPDGADALRPRSVSPRSWKSPSAGPSRPPMAPPHMSTTSSASRGPCHSSVTQALHRVHLDVVERRRDRLLLHGDHAQGVERGLAARPARVGHAADDGTPTTGWLATRRGAALWLAGPGGVAEWLRQGPAKPCTPVRFRPPPPSCDRSCAGQTAGRSDQPASRRPAAASGTLGGWMSSRRTAAG